MPSFPNIHQMVQVLAERHGLEEDQALTYASLRVSAAQLQGQLPAAAGVGAGPASHSGRGSLPHNGSAGGPGRQRAGSSRRVAAGGLGTAGEVGFVPEAAGGVGCGGAAGAGVGGVPVRSGAGTTLFGMNRVRAASGADGQGTWRPQSEPASLWEPLPPLS